MTAPGPPPTVPPGDTRPPTSRPEKSVVKNRLIWKLMLIHLVVIGFVLVIVWLSIDTLAAGYFVHLMEQYHISPEPAHAMFVDAVHRYLLWACLAAALLAAGLSFLMMRRVLTPLTRMTAITARIAAGDFGGRVPAATADEVGQLAAAFNHMAAGLEKMETLRRGLMIDVAHELRTPLTNMRGYLEALKDGVLPPTAVTIHLLHEETLRLAELVEDVLRLARADAAHDRLQLSPLDLVPLVAEIRAEFSSRLEARRIRVSQQISPQIPLVNADRDRIRRVLRNLFDNAVRHSPPAGRLEIRISAPIERVRVTLVNPGNEVHSADLPLLFERFFRSEKSRSREHGGAGIGLSIVKELVAAHGGSVGAELERDRLHVWFELPAAPAT